MPTLRLASDLSSLFYLCILRYVLSGTPSCFVLFLCLFQIAHIPQTLIINVIAFPAERQPRFLCLVIIPNFHMTPAGILTRSQAAEPFTRKLYLLQGPSCESRPTKFLLYVVTAAIEVPTLHGLCPQLKDTSPFINMDIILTS